ncbi:MAG: cytidine deaminase [Parvicella sp.]|jgi:cytidine deaminase
MEKKQILITYNSYTDVTQLDQEDQLLVAKANEILEQAYAAYSGFHVGAALLLETGEIITGNNQENIAYPSSLCAERVALYYCMAQNPNAIVKKIAIMARSEKGELLEVISPCGACRQVMSEYERNQSQSMKVILKGEDKTMITFDSVADLLPLSFDTKVL